MAQFKAKANFYLVQSDRHFDEGEVYDLQVGEADKINKLYKAAFGEDSLERIEEEAKNAKAADTAS
ncbi:TPA: hypothetical protein ACGM6T_001387 [Streptococcus agalactiae]|jgi:hypothetical protein|uniref:hypothetical protein n=1 Tax=Streptococcus anginosus TaxID=1328 RepID=UPI00189BC4B8|nr:hypothetical protein [Streptococcus anginosus]MDB8660505.1 hypothetical protein [Streptococcus anginosus]HEQ0291676.1 hypothetical protein [Streptococcus pyogenes]HES7273706.1 hypothetical protein [Streptococcus pyogenes]